MHLEVHQNIQILLDLSVKLHILPLLNGLLSELFH